MKKLKFKPFKFLKLEICLLLMWVEYQNKCIKWLGEWCSERSTINWGLNGVWLPAGFLIMIHLSDNGTPAAFKRHQICIKVLTDEALLFPTVALRSTDAADAVASFHLRASWLQDGLSSASAASFLPVAARDCSTTTKSGRNRGFSAMHNFYLPEW